MRQCQEMFKFVSSNLDASSNTCSFEWILRSLDSLALMGLANCHWGSKLQWREVAAFFALSHQSLPPTRCAFGNNVWWCFVVFVSFCEEHDGWCHHYIGKSARFRLLSSYCTCFDVYCWGLESCRSKPINNVYVHFGGCWVHASPCH